MTISEREKSERHFLRYFHDKKTKPDAYKDLERKHGKGYSRNSSIYVVFESILFQYTPDLIAPDKRIQIKVSR